MTTQEFAEMVDWIVDRCGANEVWANPDRFAQDFGPWDAVHVWGSVNAYFSDPKNANWPPNPLRVIAGARERARLDAAPERQAALPESTDGGFWKDWSMQRFGTVRRLEDVVRERHAEMEGRPTSSSQARLPGDDGWLEDGVDFPIRCRSLLCDVHRERPLEVDDDLAVAL